MDLPHSLGVLRRALVQQYAEGYLELHDLNDILAEAGVGRYGRERQFRVTVGFKVGVETTRDAIDGTHTEDIRRAISDQVPDALDDLDDGEPFVILDPEDGWTVEVYELARG